MSHLTETRIDLRLLCGLAALFLIVGLGAGSLASWDEANYAVVSKLIVQTGDWITFRWPGGGYFFDKPPLYFWLTACFYHLFGIGEFATRLPSALGGVGLVAVTYAIGRRLYGRWEGVAGAGVMLSSTDFLRYARFGTMDILQLFFFAAVILAYLGRSGSAGREPAGAARSAETAGTLTPGLEPYWGWFWAASAGCFMTKGPLVFLAWATVGLHLLATRRVVSMLLSPGFWRGFLLFGLIVLPWHIAAYQAHPEAFWREYVVKNYVTRSGQALDGHEGSAYFYIRVLINKYHPWIFLVPPALFLSVKRLGNRALRSREALLLTWIVIVFLFFTFAVRTKLNWYILPLHPALSLLVGVCLADWLRHHTGWIKPIVAAALVLHAPFSSVFRVDHSAGIRQIAGVVHSRVPEDQTIYLYDYHEQPAAFFYWDRPVAYADSMTRLDQILAQKKSVWLGVPAKAYDPHAAEFESRGFRPVVRAETRKPDDRLYLLETPSASAMSRAAAEKRNQS